MVKKKLISLIIGLGAVCGTLSAEAPVLWNLSRLYSVKTDETYANVRASVFYPAQQMLDEEDIVLTDKPTKFVSDTRYYVSIGIYWWPDPEHPDGPYIRKDGRVNPETAEYDSPKLSKMVKRVRYFALAYHFTGEARFKDALVSQLKAWFLDSETGMLPNFQYGQIHPGSNRNLGSAAGIIEAYPFNDVLDAIRLVNSDSAIDGKTMKGLKAWFAQFADWLMTSSIGLAESYAVNNHGIAYDVLLANIALFTGNTELYKKITGDFPWKRLECQIMPDGSQPLELDRTRAYHYVLYNLVHIMDFCIMQESTGNDFYKQNKGIIDSAFKWVIPYVGHPEKFLWEENLRKWPEEDKVFKTEMQRFRRLKPKNNDAFNLNDFGVDSFESVAAILK